MLSVRPDQLIFKVCDPKKSETQNLRLTNNSDKLVGYKVKTTAPKRYKVRPNIGYLQPDGGTVDLKVVLSVHKQPPAAPKPEYEDKFQIESFTLESFPDVPQVITTKEEKAAFSKRSAEAKAPKKQKLTCRFLIEGENVSEEEFAPKEELADSGYFSPEASMLETPVALEPPEPHRPEPQAEEEKEESKSQQDVSETRSSELEASVGEIKKAPVSEKSEEHTPDTTTTPAPTPTPVPDVAEPVSSAPVTVTPPATTTPSVVQPTVTEKRTESSPQRSRPTTLTSNSPATRQRVAAPTPTATLTTTAAAKIKPSSSSSSSPSPGSHAASRARPVSTAQHVPNTVEINFVFVLVAFLAGYVFAKIF